MLSTLRPPTKFLRLSLLLALTAGAGEAFAQVDGPVWARSSPMSDTPAPVAPDYRRPAAAPLQTSPAHAPAPGPVPGRITTLLSENRAAQRANPKDVQLKIREARYLSWLSRHYTAANRYRAILREHPNHVDALTGYGTALYWQGNWHESLNVLNRAVQSARPDDLAPRIALFRALAKQGRASDAHRQALDLDRQTGHRDAELGLLIADMFAAAGSRERGLPLVDRPTSDADLRVRQIEYHALQTADLNGHRSAPALADDLVRRSGRLYNSYNAAGDLLARHGFDREAIAYYEQAIAMEPEREEARLGRARVLRTRGRHREALLAFQSATQHNPESVNGWIGVAEMSRFEGQHDRAWRALDTALTIAPASADVYRERLKLANVQDDEQRFHAELARYRQVQPHDPWVPLLAAKRAAAKRRPVDEATLRRLLDPMAPDVNAEAAALLGRTTGMRPSEVAARIPKAAAPELNEAAGRELRRRLRVRVPDSVNLTVGYEHSSLKPTTTLPGAANFPDWHEAFLGGFWRSAGGQTLTFDYRHFERFGANAQQLQGGVLLPIRDHWTVGGHFGGALFGNFIPHWRLGAEAAYQATERLGLRFEYRHLRFTDEPVHQFIPEINWTWHPRFHSTGRLYVTRDAPPGASADTGLTFYFDLAYRVASTSHVKVHYANGDQNASALIQALVGQQNYQSTGVELRLGINERWAVIPSYRWERYALFDLHAVGLALNGRF